MKTLVKSTLSTTLGLFYPEICALCLDEPALAEEGFVGAKCRQFVQYVRPPFCQRCGLPFEGHLTTSFECTNCRDMDLFFTSARAAVVAKTIVLDVIHHYKYSSALWFENFLAALLLGEAVPVLRGQNWNFIVPVPLHPLKKRERGFNQAELLAAQLSRAAGVPLNTNLLRRVKSTATQTLLRRDQRAVNMHGAFAVQNRLSLDGEKIVLVDDVFTTGATTNDCARAKFVSGQSRAVCDIFGFNSKYGTKFVC